MARRVFFSFHYKRDIRRVVQVRNSWVVRGSKETQPFLDRVEWEKIKIKRSYELGKGILGIFINRIKDPQLGTDSKGKNPLDYWNIDGVPFSRMYKSYDWVSNDGYQNISGWIESAAKSSGR